ncbi:hypothetical protein Drorol1_Dr00020748 [Drosera rotundifolia]
MTTDEAVAVCCDLQVDVYGQEVLWVNEFTDTTILHKSLATFSSRVSNLLLNKHRAPSSTRSRADKVIFLEFPGGPLGFELMAQFCHHDGDIEITHSNVLLLDHAARYMGMGKPVSGIPNLLSRSEEFIGDVESWAWSDLLVALGNGQHLVGSGCNASSSHMKDLKVLSLVHGRNMKHVVASSHARHSLSRFLFEERAGVRGLIIEQMHSSNGEPKCSLKRLVHEVVERILLLETGTPSKCTSVRSSCDSRSTVTKSELTGKYWWFDDLASLNIEVIEVITRKMVKERLDQAIVSKFLCRYLMIRVLDSSRAEKIRVVEKVIILFDLLDKKRIFLKGLLSVLRVASNLRISKCCREKLERMIGFKLDQATADDLLIPAPSGTRCMYNVDLVIRLVKIFFLAGNCKFSLTSLKKVGRLMDLYASEIAADVHLKPSTFSCIVFSLPDSARESCDRIYQAINVYFEVHKEVEESQKLRICSAINYAKLSHAKLTELAQNWSFPLLARSKAKVYHNLKYKDSTNNAYRRLKIIAGYKGGNTVKELVLGKSSEKLSGTICYDLKQLNKLAGFRMKEILERTYQLKNGDVDGNKGAKGLYRVDNAMYLPKLC